MKLGRTARFYATHPKSREKKKRYDTSYHATPARKKYRAELNKARRKRKLKGDEQDLSHTSSGSLVLENKSINRSRQGANNKSTLK